MKNISSILRTFILTYGVFFFFFSCEQENSIDITPKNPVVEISVHTQPELVIYKEGDALDLTGMLVIAKFQDGSSKNIKFEEFERNRIRTSPNQGTPLSQEVTFVKLTHLTSSNSVEFPIEVKEPHYLPLSLPSPTSWPDNNIYFVTNFKGVDQVDGGNANNNVVNGAWVWAGGDLDNINWSVQHTENYSYLNLPFKNNGNGWGAWMWGAGMNLPNEIEKLKWVSDIRGNGRWLLQLVDNSDTHYSIAIDLATEDGWIKFEKSFTDFGLFDVSTITTIKVSIENDVTAIGDFIHITNIQFVVDVD